MIENPTSRAGEFVEEVTPQYDAVLATPRTSRLRRVAASAAMIVTAVSLTACSTEPQQESLGSGTTGTELQVGENIGADQTVVLPSGPEPANPDYTLPRRPKDAITLPDYTCDVPSVPMPNMLTNQEAMRGAETEFALPMEAYREAFDAIQAAKKDGDLATIQQITADTFARAGVRVSFDDPALAKDDLRYKPTLRLVTDPDKLQVQQYGANILNYLKVLTLVPKEMVDISQLDFVSSAEIDTDKHDNKTAVGLYIGGTAVIRVAAYDHGGILTLAHELGHHVQDKACANPTTDVAPMTFGDNDTEYTQAFRRAELMLSDTVVAGRDIGGYDLTTKNKAGFPTPYSMSSPNENLAEKVSRLIAYGSFVEQADDPLTDKSGRQLQELVLSRMAAAMPGVDVPAWLAYLSKYSTQTANDVSPERVRELRLSPMDHTIAYLGDAPDNWTIEPAVALEQPGKPTEFIYGGYTTYDSKYPVAEVNFATSRNKTEDRYLKDAARNYLEKLRKKVPRFNAPDIVLQVEDMGNAVRMDLLSDKRAGNQFQN